MGAALVKIIVRGIRSLLNFCAIFGSVYMIYRCGGGSRTQLDWSLVGHPCPISWVASSWNVMAHGDARLEKWRGNWRMEWVASTLTLPRNVVYPALLLLMRTPRLPVVDWTDVPADLNGFVRFAERRNLVSARVPSRFKRSITWLLSLPGKAAGAWSWPLTSVLCRRYLAWVKEGKFISHALTIMARELSTPSDILC